MLAPWCGAASRPRKESAMGSSQAQARGWALLRIGIGIMFVIFGWRKVCGGPEMWSQIGQAMGAFGLKPLAAYPVFWGFMATLAEFGGGLALVLGVLVRPFAFLMGFTMATAVTMLVKGGKDMMAYSHALDMGIVFVAILIGGGGTPALGAVIPGLRGRWFQ